MPASLWHWLAVVAAALLAVAGVAILTLALFRDRAKGLPRCPRCWYSMAGAPGLKCPECGYEAGHARRLLKTRRRWRRAAIGVLMLIVAAVTAVGEPMLRKGVVQGTPTWVYIVALPWLEERGEGMKELYRRAIEGEMREWEYRALVNQILDELEGNPNAKRAGRLVEVLDTLFLGATHNSASRPYLSWARLRDLDTPRMVTTLLALLDSREDHTTLVIFCLENCLQSAATIIPVLMCHLYSDETDSRSIPEAINKLSAPYIEDRGVFFPAAMTVSGNFLSIDREFHESVTTAGKEVPELVRAFSNGLRTGDANVRLCSIWGLFHLARNQPDVQGKVFALSEDPSEEVRAMVVAFAGLVPVTQASIGVLRANLADADPVRRSQGLSATRMLGSAGRVLESDVRPLLSDAQMRHESACCWLSIGAPKDVLRDVLQGAMAQAEDRQLPTLLHIAAITGEGGSELLQAVVKLMHHPRYDVRTVAAYASLRLGGEKEVGTRVLVEAAYAKMLPADSLSWRDHPDMLLATLSDHQLLDIPPLVEWLALDQSSDLTLPVSLLESCGSSAAAALPTLRELKPKSPRIADYVDHAIKRIEWEVAHPKEAAKLRKQRDRD